MFEFQKPEVTTVVRWLLRVILVAFLAWLVRRRPEQEEEEELDPAEVRRTGAAKMRPPATRTATRMQQQQQQQQRREPYPQSNLRQRRGEGGSVDFDAVIDKMSKPKDMWEVRKSGDGHSHIVKRLGSSQDTSFDSMRRTPSDQAGGNGGGSERKRLQLTRGNKEADEKEAQSGCMSHTKATLHGHERPVTFITWNRDSNLLFTCGKDKIVCVWSFPEGECLGVYTGHNGAVWSCSVTNDSRWLITSGADRLVIIWEARTSRELCRVELPGVVRCVEWAIVGRDTPGDDANASVERFVTCHNRFGSHPPALTVWRFDGAEKIEQLLTVTDLPTPATQVRWGRGDYFLVSSHENGELVFWRSDTGAEVKRLKAPNSEACIQKFDFSSDREVVATASLDKHIRVWDIGKGTEWKLLYDMVTDRPLNAVALGPITRAAAAAEPGERPTNITVLAAGGQDARDVAKSSSDSEQFGTMLLKFGDAEEWPCELKPCGVTKGHFGPVHTLAFARDGSAMASGSEDGCVRLHVFTAASGAEGAGPDDSVQSAHCHVRSASKDVRSPSKSRAE
mmetsp:Transcript_8752/g.19224  ORF Transcript_8752/g.19224 Transcript_8752/m.19224 type:complete len:564 (-) Transcript_8752:113-1804(-)